MKLVTMQVRRFRNVLDSEEFAIDPNITCLVGKNESGKTAMLEAMYRLDPARPDPGFSILENYPAWREKADRAKGEKLEEIEAVTGTYKLEPSDTADFEKRFGPGVLKSDSLIISRRYDGKRIFKYTVDEGSAVRNLFKALTLPEGIASEARECKTVEHVRKLIAALTGRSEDAASEVRTAAAAIQSELDRMLGEDSISFATGVENALYSRVPFFFYFSNYSNLPARIKIRDLLAADAKTLKASEQTALALLRLGGTDNDYLLDENYERRKRELENVANALTQEVLQYWTQNVDLRVHIDLTHEVVPAKAGGQQTVVDELKIRLYDAAHWLSLPFSDRSTGFQWFFSFLAAFSDYERRALPVVILLDEPALALHARAQADFLRFIEERLSVRHQVIYTTHSPFMIQPGRLDRVRLVEDGGRDVGSKVSKDVLATNRDTLSPLQGALGFDLVQHILIGPNNLVVEGTSDFTYVVTISDYLKSQDRTGLDDRFSIRPVGGADLIPTFVALLGHHLGITVLVDGRRESHQKLARLAKEGYLADKRLVFVGELLGKASDIEDLFHVDDYLALYNAAFSKELKAAGLPKTAPRIVERIAKAEKVEKWDHGLPADYLLRNRDKVLPKLRSETLDNFEKLFQALNATLPPKS
jgi:energy-coupling factor transporter ATP-binding protein EcfA2